MDEANKYGPNERLRRRRFQRRWTQVSVAVKLGVSATTVNRWENGAQRPQLEHVEKLCRLFAASAAELGLEDEAQPASIDVAVVAAGSSLKSRGSNALRFIPELDPELVPTTAHEGVLAELLGTTDARNPPRVVALRGPGGFGKTSLARRLCHDALVQEEFPDGQAWVETGPDCTPARVVQLVADLCVQLGVNRPNVGDPDQAGYLLAQAIGERRLLLVVDNVWSARDLQPFLTGGPNCMRLVTTQNAGVCPAATVEHPVGPMAATEIEQMLKRTVPNADVDVLVPLCGGWPLLARVVGASVRRDIEAGARPRRAIALAEQELRSSGPGAFDVWDSDQRTSAIGGAVRLGTERLREHVRIGPHADLHERYLSLAIFPPDGIPLRVLAHWWSRAFGWTSPEVRRFCHELMDRSLVARYDAESATILLHDVFRTYVRSALGDRIAEISQSLLDAYRTQAGWLRACDDEEYLLANLSRHLVEAGLRDEAVLLLLEPAYVLAKATRLGHLSLQADAAVAAGLRAEGNANAARAGELLDGSFLLFGMDRIDDMSATLDCLIRRTGGRTDDPIRSPPRDILPGRPHLQTSWASQVVSGDAVATVSAHVGAVTSVAVGHVDGEELVATGGEDGTVRIWQARGGSTRASLTGHTGWVDAVAISGRRGLVASAGEDQVIRLWNVHDGSLAGVLIGHAARVRSLAFSSSGRILISGAEDGRACIWDVAGQKLAATLCDDDRRVWATAIDRDSRSVAIGGEGGRLRLMRLASGAADELTVGTVEEVAGHDDWIRSVAFAGAVGMAVTGSGDGSVGVWRLHPELTLESRVNVGPRVRSVAVSDDLGRIAAGCEDGTVRIWRGVDDEADVLQSGSDWVRSVAIGTTSHTVFAACEDGMLRAWDMDTGRLHSEFGRFQDVAWSAAWLPTGIAAIGTASGRIELRQADSGELLKSLDAGRGRVWSLAVDESGRHLAAACGDGIVRLWNLLDPARPVELGTGDARSWCVALDPDGLRLAAGVGSGRVRVWDTRTNEMLFDRADHAARVRSLAFEGSGRRLLTGSGDGTVRLVDTEAGGDQVFDNEGEWVRAVSLDPAGRYVAAGSRRGGIRIWDRTMGNLSVILAGHTGRVLALRFTPSGRHLLSGAADGTLRCWDIAGGSELCRVRVDATLLTCAVDAAGKSFLAATARHLVAVSVMSGGASVARS